MRVIQTVPDISHEASGPSYSVLRLCESLIARQVDCHLASLVGQGAAAALRDFHYSFPLLGPRRLGTSPAMNKWLADQACKDTNLVLHNHSLWMMPNVYPGQIAKKYAVPYIVSPRGTFTEYALSIGSRVKPLFWRLVQAPSLRAVTCFHATAASEYDDIRRVGFRQPVAVIPNGIDIKSPLPKQPRKQRTLLFLGRVHPNKGIDFLVSAWARVQDQFPDWVLDVVGPDEGGHLAELEAQVKALDAQRIRFIPGLFGDEKHRAYCEADMFILPSHAENFGMTVAESLAAGTPAIVTKGAPWRGLDDWNAGRWVDLSVDSLVASMTELMSLPDEKRDAMGQAGRNWMEQEFGWAGIARMMHDAYRWAKEGGDKPDFIIVD